MGVSGQTPLTASEGGESQIDTRSVERYQINMTVGSSCNKYPAKQHARKVATALGASRGLIYLAGRPTLYDTDMPSAFRQQRYFYYLSGVNEADCYLTYDIEKDFLMLYIPKSDLQQAIWYGPLMTVSDARQRYDIDGARYVESLTGDISFWIKQDHGKSVIFILGGDEPPELDKKKVKYLDARRLQPAMDACRGVKDHYEIEMIRRANVVSDLAHTAVLRNVRKMTSEAEIAGLFLYTSMSHGAPNQSYGIIAGSGENASILHYMKNDQPFGKRPLVCLDAGAEFECYASDVTRTFPLGADGEWPSDESRDIYRVVERMQEECIRKIKKGVRFLDLHVHAHIIAIEELSRLGIFRGGTVDEIRQSGASKLFFPHGLGHHIGLDVHDVSGTSIMADRANDFSSFLSVMPALMLSPCTFSASLLEENMVVTVEPGIYFNRLAIESARTKEYADYIDFDVVEKYIPIGGVRIEDDILVTADGYENLTTAPKGDKALELIRTSM